MVILKYQRITAVKFNIYNYEVYVIAYKEFRLEYNKDNIHFNYYG